MKTAIIVQNLKCDGCAKTITSKLLELYNISDFRVEVETSTVSFTAKNGKDVHIVENKLKSLSYPPVDDKNSMAAKTISFVSCVMGKISKQ